MKKLMVIVFGMLVFFACTNQTKKATELAVLTVDELQVQGKEMLGKEVIVKGMVTHVCKEGGARCFIMGSTEDISIRIEAGKIGAFTQEQMGSEVEVRGILQEVQLDEEDLAELGAADTDDHAHAHDGPKMHDLDGGNHDSINRTKKLEEMGQKLAESVEGYVPVYYLEGLELIPAKK